MLEQGDFEKWIRGIHYIFEVFEQRYDPYHLTARWVSEWFASDAFNVYEGDNIKMSQIVENFNFGAYKASEEVSGRAIGQISGLIDDCLFVGNHTNVGWAVALYLFIWNYARFRQYLEDNRFDVKEYFDRLGQIIIEQKESLRSLNNMKLIENSIDEERLKTLFAIVNTGLKVSQHNEHVGTIKILHICAPFFCPLIDNYIAENTKLKPNWEPWNFNHYIRWVRAMKSWLSNYDNLRSLEREFQSSILKLVDEGLYVICSLDLKLRIERLGLNIM